MDDISALPAVTPSTKSYCKSPKSSSIAASPKRESDSSWCSVILPARLPTDQSFRKAPVEPPKRLSSLAFARAVPSMPLSYSPPSPVPAGRVTSTVPRLTSPVRTPCNTSRKRIVPSPFAPAPTTNDQDAGIDQRFHAANASLQFDVTFAASPAGSIGSRLPTVAAVSGERRSPETTPSRGTQCSQAYDWRYSTIPHLFGQKEQDVREPFPDRSPSLPYAPRRYGGQSKASVTEPVSSGFSTPAARVIGDVDMEKEVDLSPLPESGPILSRSYSAGDAAGYGYSSSDDSLHRPPVVTDLEGPLTELSVNHAQQPPDTVGEESPIVAHLRRQYGQSMTEDSSPDDSPDQAIFLSTPAKAAANSAKMKRGLLKHGCRSSSNQEHLEPCADPLMHVGAGFPAQSDGAAFLCPDPAVHGIGTSTTTMLVDPPGKYTSVTPDVYGRHPARANLLLPAPFHHRVDASGSPIPVLTANMPPASPGVQYPDPRPVYSPTSRSIFTRPDLPLRRPSPNPHYPSLDTEHFQPGWYNCPVAPAPPVKSPGTTYKFSTAAARILGSSPAPDLRIRDSYRTDTLTPLARPASRFRKNGIGAAASVSASTAASRGVGRYYANAVYGGRRFPSAIPILHSRPSSRGVHLGQPQFASSAPRPVVNLPKRRRTRRDHTGRRADFEIYDEERASVPDTVAESVEPMEIDENIKAAVRMSIVATPNNDEAVVEGLQALSPNVTPCRKRHGQGEVKRIKRRASYWDRDLPELSGKREGKVFARVQGVKSSPPRGTREYHYSDELDSQRVSLDVDSDTHDFEASLDDDRLEGKDSGGGLGGGGDDDYWDGSAEGHGENDDVMEV